MKRIGQAELSRANWGGLKPVVRQALLWPPVNAIARPFSPRVPVAAPRAWYSDGDFQVSMLQPRDCQVAAELHRHGGQFRKPSDNLVMRYLRSLALESATFLDLGAYTGLFALTAAKTNPNLTAHAFEIVPQTYLLAVRNVIDNDLVGRVHVHLQGLGPEPSKIVLPALLNSSSLPSSLSLGSDFQGGVSVPVDRLDSLLPNVAGPVGVKIDVEGWEPQVFAGAAAFLDRHRPDIIAEVLPGEGAAVSEILRPLGYRFWRFTDTGLVEQADLAGVKGERDWLFTCRDKPLAY